MSTSDSMYEARKAAEEAIRRREAIQSQTPRVESETQQLSFLLQENNLARRFRKAMLLNRGTHD